MAESKSSLPQAPAEHVQTNEEHYLGVYWLARTETAERCAQRTEHFFQSLASCDRNLSNWYGKGWTLEEALEKRIETHASALRREFLQQQEREGRMQGEGFSLSLWNGENQEGETGLSLLCGEASPWVTNSCVLRPPQEGPMAERLVQAPTFSRILRAMVLAFEPEWGIATSHEHLNRVTESAEAGTFVGWLTYFSHRRGALPALPPPVQLEPVAGLGTLVLLTPERFSIANPTHLELAREVSERLAHAGLLIPLTPGSH